MEDSGGGKVTGIRQIVRLKGLLQKWKAVTFGPKDGRYSQNHVPTQKPVAIYGRGGISPEVSRRIMSSSQYDSDDDICPSPEPPFGVPRGYLAVYVGLELRRFIIPTDYLEKPLFKVLLEKVEEEYGFDHRGALTIPCEIETFKYLLQCLDNHRKEQVGSSSAQKPVSVQE